MQARSSLPSTGSTTVVVRWIISFALLAAASTSAQAQTVVGTNVNMVGAPGYVNPATGEIINDPTLNRQNEPSHAYSTRNPCHLLAGANDYRLVDFETELIGDERADAWLGVFKSFDCGRTWTSTPHPGNPLDVTDAGRAAPIYGRQAAADPTVRALPAGKFLMSGLAFDRGGIAQVFVSLFQDQNNVETGDAINWLGTTVLDSGQSGQFLDKPWLATTKDGVAFIAYTVFLGSGNNIHTQIKIAKFNGTTWSQPQKVSESVARNQGTTIAVDPGTGYVYVAWREFTDPRDSIVVVRSTDGGNRFSAPARVEPLNASGQAYRLKPFDQDASFVTFRTFSYPTMAIMPAVAEGRPANQPGRVYLAFAARGFVPLRNNTMPGQTSNQVLGDARIVYTTSLDGVTWTYPKVADGGADAGHQLMPALASAGGKLALAYYDLRADTSLTFDDNIVEYGQAALDSCMAQSVGVEGFNVVQCMITLPSVVAQRRHTLDVRAAVADGACLLSGTCSLQSVSALNGNRLVSRYLQAFAGPGPSQGLVQLQYNAPDLPLFQKGSRAFIGDYIDIQGLDYVPNGSGGWAWNTGANAGSPSPLFMVTWTDNRNVRRPGIAGTAGWARFTRINSTTCEPGQAGIRNQDIYSAVIRTGMSVSAPLNARRIGDLQRSFPIVIANNTDQPRNYQASVSAPANVVASFDQFAGFGVGAPVISLQLSIPPRSTATRTLFVLKADGAEANVLVPVLVAEVGGTAQASTVFLNPDLSNPDAADASVNTEEFHVPVLADPTLQTFTNTPDIKTPDFETPDFETPDFETPDFETPDFETPDFETPDFETPDFETPDFETPDFETPDFETAAVADVSWKVTNTGNVTSAYKPNINIQDSKIGTKYQLVVRTVTVQSLTSALSCKPGLLPQNQLLVNIVDPHVDSRLVGLTSQDFNNPDPKNATFTLGSQQSAVITLRAYCNANYPGANGPDGCATDGPLPLDALGRPLVSASSVAQAANCQRCTAGNCNLDDFVGSGTACTLDDGLPKDVYDPIPPVFGPAPAPTADDGNGNGNEDVTFTLSVGDNIAVTTVSCSDGSVSPGPSGSFSVSGTFLVGTTEVTCDAADESGNHAELTFNVVVHDITPPVFNLPAGSDPGAPFGPSNPAEASGPDGAVVTYTNPTATDNNGGPVQVTCGPVSGSTFQIGTTDVNCTATDDSGVSTPPTNLFDITVRDTTGPTIAAHGDVTAQATSAAGAVVTYTSPTTTDNVDPAGVASCLPASGSAFVLGNTSVTCSATDTHSNTTSIASFVVHVVDTTAPVVTVPGNIVGIQATSSAGAVVNYSATATDLVDTTPTVVCVAASGSTFAIGTSTVNCTASDDFGNTSAPRAFTVTVVDTAGPVVTVPAPITRTATSLSGAVVTFTASAQDLVDGSRPVTCVPASGSTFPIGTTTVNCSATDSRGNRGTNSFTVTVTPLVYGFVGVQNLPPPAGKAFKPGSAVPLKWQFTVGGVAVDSTQSNPKITITGPAGTMTFTAPDPGKSSFQPPTAANGWTWQFNWQTVTPTGANLPTGIYSVSITSQATGQTFSGGSVQLK